MKKIILLILFALPLSGQIKFERGEGLFWADSLWGVNDTLVVIDSTFGADTVVVIDSIVGHNSSKIALGQAYEWMILTVIDTGATYTDSARILFPTYKLVKKASIDGQTYPLSVTWRPIPFIRDSVWAVSRLIPSGGLVQTYQVYVANCDSIQIVLDNVESVTNRVWWFQAVFSRKK